MDKELVQRVRRIETRLTQLMTAMGVPTSAQKPAFNKKPGEHPILLLPSPHSSLKEIADAIPDQHRGEHTQVWLGADRVGTFIKT